MNMSAGIKILLVEDTEHDAELVVRELRRNGIDFDSRRVQTESDLRRDLQEFRPDIVLSDFAMPGFNGLAALKICKEWSTDTPFIFMSGAVGEEIAVEAMRSGASDYVMKSNLVRLAPAVTRELREAAKRIAADQALRENMAGLRRAQVMAKLASVVTRPDGSFESWSETLPQLIGMPPDQTPRTTRDWLALIHP